MPFLAEEHIDIPNKDLLSWMFDDQKYDQDEPIYIDAADPSRTISSRQARSIIQKLAAGFKAIGLQKGDCVCMLSFNDIYYSMAFLGIVASSCVFAGVNPSHTTFELAHAWKISQTRALLVEPSLAPSALKAAKLAGIPRSRIFIFDHHTPLSVPSDGHDRDGEGLGNEEKWGGLLSWRSLLHHGSTSWPRWDSLHLSATTTAARLFSSGTTGLPKAVEMTHRNFIAQHTMVIESIHRNYPIRRLLCTPMFHVSNVPRAHTSPLRAGTPTVIMPRFELSAWLSNIHRFAITEVNMVPPMVLRVLSHPTLPPAEIRRLLSSVRFAWVGAAPLAPEPQARFKALLGADTPFNQVWGMSETSCIATMIHWPEHDGTGSVGRFLPGMDAKLVDDDGVDITGYDVRGELCVRGPLVVKGYFGDEGAKRTAWDGEGYFHTGDVAVRKRANGLWYIVDRKKELIKVRGFQVAPAELEGVILGVEGVVDVAVIGVAEGGSGGGFEGAAESGSEVPRAYIVKREGAEVDEGTVRRWMKERLAGYKQLDGGIVFVDAIPKNASGKILKKELREIAKREMGAKL
ncbi:4-coumarate-CoA ligase-like protein [Aaosphaeria arxii CBS 175.79]|uniref:4-coumarate-CoA ligase-like protein n=1 Tax=Aaosphaeria arxii CBS 175.79 TaxID=1450172 RepID=A0A6A5XJW1_9PLEO|nr:4-coumarate-CoA ligase-like protein [Aaosphaeria arxii CBS 175.79]KAF2013565.1 4-coumarate-CoA ligase-like protein [Aaosphaeria arxii CBS 175.79]